MILYIYYYLTVVLILLKRFPTGGTHGSLSGLRRQRQRLHLCGGISTCDDQSTHGGKSWGKSLENDDKMTNLRVIYPHLWPL